ELLEDLRCHRQNIPLRHAPDRSAGERIAKWTRRHPRLASGTTVSFIAGIGLICVAALWWQGRNHNERLGAESRWQQFQSALPDAIMALSTPGNESELLADGLRQSSHLLQQWQIDSDQWQQLSGADHLTASQMDDLGSSLAQLMHLSASAEDKLAIRMSEDAASSLHHSDTAKALRAKAEQFFPGAIPTSLSESAIASSPTGVQGAVRDRLRRQPTNVTLWYQLAGTQMGLGEFNNAITTLDVCAQMRPDTLAIMFNRGICQLHVGQYRKAIADFTRCLDLHPSLVNSRFNRAAAFHRLGDHQAALNDLDRLIDGESGQSPRLRFLLFRAEVYDAIHDASRASADRERASQIAPRDVHDFLARGYLRIAVSREAAIKDFLAAEKLDPRNTLALENLASLYAERLEDTEKSIRCLDRLIELLPNSAGPVASRGILEARLGQTDAAISDAQAAAELSPAGREKLQIAGIYALVSAPVDSGQDSGNPTAALTWRSQSLKWLARALKTEPQLASLAWGDHDLDAIRGDAQFGRLIQWAQLLDRSSR
ncbi:MAG: tetratricopeptide repeat protein, partial [Planctomycetales bacterium]|nr:tetratricopeptide repeat protein [Planctomycetales bacterium]